MTHHIADGGLDVATVRAAAPGFEDHIHFNNAGSSIPDRSVTDSMVDYLRFEERVGGYEAMGVRADEVGRFRPALADLLGVTAGEIAFAPNDTVGYATAAWGLAATGTIRPGSRVVVDRAQYVSHYLALLQLSRMHDLELVVAPSDDRGVLDLDGLAGLLDERVSAVSLTHVGTHRGSVNPVAAAGEVIRANSDARYLLDVCQSVGQLPVDLRSIGCDVATATGRKFLRGPRGSGLLYVRQEIQDRIDGPGIDGAHTTWIDASTYESEPTARRFEPFEASFAVQVGLGVAVDLILELGIDAIAARVVSLAEELRAGLSSVDGVQVHDGGRERCGIVTFTEARVEPVDTQRRLTAAGIATSVTHADSARLDLGRDGCPSSAVRASVHYPNTSDEIARLLAVLAG